MNNQIPLHDAAYHDSEYIGEQLILKGANINTKDIESQYKLLLFFLNLF